MCSRVRFSQWRQKLSGPRGGAAAAGALAVILAVLLGLGVAAVLPSARTGARAAAAEATRPGQAASPFGQAVAEPAESGSGAPGARAAGNTGTSKSGTSKSVASGSAASKAGASKAATSKTHTRKGGTSRSGRTSGTIGSGAGHRASPAPAADAGSMTSCSSVAHIGDSTSVGMVSPLDLPDSAQRLSAQYRDVGIRHAWIDASGGRSMVEEMPGLVNGYNTARHMVSRGFRGCWVIALGTNDTANVSVGSSVGRMARIQELMSVAHGAPVMWVNVETLDRSGPWSEANMQLWNDTLLQACQQYPNLRIFDWASAAQPGWFISDGIHYTSAGFAIRAHMIAWALTRAFPRSGSSAGCVVR